MHSQVPKCINKNLKKIKQNKKNKNHILECLSDIAYTYKQTPPTHTKNQEANRKKKKKTNKQTNKRT